VTVWIDQPIWPAHGRLFAHLVSDVSYEELHVVARAAGLHPRAFEGDHYDVPEERWRRVVEAGAMPTNGIDLARRLNASGLRLRKRKGDRGLARLLDVPFPNGSSDIDLVASEAPIPQDQVFAALVFIRDRRGDFAAVHSVRRAEWGSPGGWRDGDETPLENAVREAFEETGIRLRHSRVFPCGYERFTPRTDDNVIDPKVPYLQVYRTRLDDVRPALNHGDEGVHETRWVTPEEYAVLCGHLFWWPLAAEVFPDLRG
jgi:8-oxo-dGTP pyrophosphatase MutT (NUDIX family)